MKTKIIYISGNETFEMTQIRAAFEEVRATLGLDNDTILFGVPVDCDSALSDVQADSNVAPVSEPIPTTEIVSDVTPVSEIISVESDDSDIESVSEIASEPDTESDEDSVETVVPILSVLGMNDSESVSAQIEPEDIVDTESDIVTDTVNQNLVSGIETDMTVDAEPVVITETPVDIEDIADDTTPETPMEKTLEQLLESMTPLREDVVLNENATVDTPETSLDVLPLDDTDATLAQLASEFVQNEDKISSAPKAETSGKIGKLKNILPFKKAKRDDSGLMGDLFGWAGIAANDEDFSIPGFFTQAASKK